ncbi:hypothetical protein HanXRQr2_Chr17g0784131 [Helianthus annuus]|uniref:GAF domain-containing protein n=2 Tax=Helianthus annuus TaxID=4232 RepID=A0A9K3DH63_HELAN|nr:hypothetical protein HanXRQr2_Chr17g0784131 [Helianthus annuus]KAJ0431694.1 hypothetical protein HanIR_Chr17g0851161 [Helianthus annuus]KAJ0811570.1 hypothetical protein HanPSC8_Chr17g0752151 [Helianthus annuus]
MQSKINNVMRKFNFEGQSGSLQYWEYKQSGHKGRLTVADQLFVSSRNQRGLREYRNHCLKKKVSVGPDTEVDQEYLAGLAAQKKVAFERTSCDPDQILGQLVVPVFSYQGADKKLIGVIELTTFFVKESYEEDFNQIQSLLQNESLATTYMANI